MTVHDQDVVRHGVVRRADARMEDVDRRLAALERRAEHAAEDAVAQLEPLVSRMRANRDAVRSAIERLRSGTAEVWEPLARDVERGYKQLRIEVDIARSELEAELAETPEAYQQAVEQQLESWRRRLDQLRVQAKLAQMETRDDVVELLERMEEAYRVARHDVDEAKRDAAATVESVRTGVASVFGNLRESADAAWRKLTRGD